MFEEAKFYNALNVALQSEYPAYPELKKLLAMHGNWQKAWQKGNYKLDIEAEWQKLEKNGVRLIMLSDADYPELLKEIPLPPFGLYVKGDLTLDKPSVAIVGTRKATSFGIEIAKKFGRALSEKGLIVVSGLAMGIDEAAHKGTVEAKSRTIAVLAVGLERVYPQQNFSLAQKILDSGGALVSEYPIGANSYPTRFIERNRIISGLSKGVIIIEAPEKSGALATARFALDQNREVLIATGPFQHPNYAGSIGLIRAGARLVNSVEDVLEDLGLEDSIGLNLNFKTGGLENLSEDQAVIYAILVEEGRPITIDKICELSKFDIQSVNRVLAFLVLRGIVKESGGKYFI